MLDEEAIFESELAVMVLSGDDEEPVIRVKDDVAVKERIRQLLEEANQEVADTRRKVALRAPETHPDEYLLVQWMLEDLASKGEFAFWPFARTDRVKDEFGRVSGSYQPAISLFLKRVELEIG